MSRLQFSILFAALTLIGGCNHASPTRVTSAVACADTADDPESVMRQYPSAADSECAYQSSLTRLIEDAFRCGRLHPQNGLTLETPSGRVQIPISYHGMVWLPEEVGELHSTREVRVRDFLNHHHTRPGCGVPLIGVSRDAGLRGSAGRFLAAPRPITLTAVLRREPSPVLEVYDTTHVETVTLDGQTRPLAADLSAPLAYMGKLAKEIGDDRYLSQFLRPNINSNYDQLFGLEPYRPGTFPLCFVHGAKSDNVTWLDTLNDLRADPEFTRRFQVITFRYATGGEYLSAAANLREQGQEYVRVSDPTESDPALRSWVLVGYSLGGPVCRLAVSSSGSALWEAFSTKPLDALVTTDAMRARLRRIFFFEPLPYVRTAVFIASPFSGGTAASDTLFRLGTRLIRYPEETERNYQQLQQDNPTAIRPAARGRIPTSLDLLQSDNWLLNALRGLPFADGVRVHTIIGDGMPFKRSDRVVPVTSARVPEAITETRIDMFHKDAQKHPMSVAQQREILNEHATTYGPAR